MPTINQAAAFFERKSVDATDVNRTPELSESNFTSLILNDKSNSEGGEQTGKYNSSSTSEQSGNVSVNNDHERKHLRQDNTTGSMQSKLHLNTKMESQEKAEDFSLIGAYKRVVTTQALGKSEIYEQSAFAINKLSYLDVPGNVHTPEKISTDKISNAIISYTHENNTRGSIAEALTSHTTKPAYTTVNPKLKAQDVTEKKAFGNLNKPSVNDPYLIEKSRTKIALNKGKNHLYIRDYFSSTPELESKISDLLRSIKFAVSKIFVNGKEK